MIRLLALLLLACSVSAGEYVDSTGARHPWRTDSNGMLHWDGRPFVPVGGMFCFAYLSEYNPNDPPGNDARWKRDVELLEQIRGAGIRHLYVNPVNPATRIGPAVWKRCLDELERLDFEYGIEITDGPESGMDGYLIGGGAWEFGIARGVAEIRFRPEGEEYPLLKGLIAIAADGAAHPVSLEPSRKATWILQLPPSAAGDGVTLVPRIVAPKGFNVADLWGGYEEYERRLLGWMRQLGRPPGLRFIVDPFTNEMNLYGYTSQMIPAARGGFIPVAGNRWLLDPATLRTRKRTGDGGLRKLIDWRDDSIAAYCGRLSKAIRKGYADLPIIHKHVGRLTRFMTRPSLGADGIGLQAWGRDLANLARTGGPAIAVTRHWNRFGWLPVTETGYTPEAVGAPPGYPSQEAMFAHLDRLLQLGARGFYLFALRPLPEELLPDFCLHKDPKQLAWIAEYARALETAPRAGRLKTRPRIRFKPVPAGPGAVIPISEFRDGALWLPRSTPRRAGSRGR